MKLLTLALVLFAALALTGCANDAALREAAGRFTNENEAVYKQDRRPDLEQAVVNDRAAMFRIHRNVAAGRVDNPESGEALRAQLLDNLNEQHAAWESDRQNLDPDLLRIRRKEQASQLEVIRGK